MRLIVLRPEPGAAATVALAASLGLEAAARPLFRVEPRAWSVPDPAGFDGLLLTSANAVRTAGPRLAELASLPVYAVGGATAAAATDAGLTVAATGTSGVAALLGSLPPALRLLHLAGAHRVEVTPRQPITVIPVYRSVAVEPAPELAALAPAVLLVHSARAGGRAGDLLAQRERFRVAAISPAAAAACGNGWAELAAAAEPTDRALLSLAARLCQSPLPK